MPEAAANAEHKWEQPFQRQKDAEKTQPASMERRSKRAIAAETEQKSAPALNQTALIYTVATASYERSHRTSKRHLLTFLVHL